MTLADKSQQYTELVHRCKLTFMTNSPDNISTINCAIAMAYYDIIDWMADSATYDSGLLCNLIDYFEIKHLLDNQLTANDVTAMQQRVFQKLEKHSKEPRTWLAVQEELCHRMGNELDVIARTKKRLLLAIQNLNIWADAKPNTDGSQPLMVISKLTK